MSPKVHVELAYFEIRFCHSDCRRGISRPSRQCSSPKPCKHVTNELVIRWSITERVKRLAGNEIELGIGYRQSNLGQVTYWWQREQRMLLCGLTDKDLRRICRSQYEHPGSATGDWPETCLGHVYIVLEPVGSARLKLDDGYIMSLCVMMYLR